MGQGEAVISRLSREVDGSRIEIPRRSTWERALPWVIALIFACLYATISVARFERLATRSFDLGIYEQAIRHYANLRAPVVDIEGVGANFLGDHWNPAIAVFAPLYRLFPTPVTLLVGQAVAIALGVPPLTRVGIHLLGRWSGVAVGLAFGMSYGIQAAVNFDVHEVCLAVPLLAFALAAFLEGRWGRVVAWAAPLVLVKEDLGLTVAAIGLVLVLVGARRWGLGLAVFGIASFALTMTILIPHFNAARSESRLTMLASEPGAGDSLLHRILDLPLELVTSEPRATTMLLLVFVTGFLGLRSPLMILVLPTLTWRFISTNQHFWGQSWHYDLVLMPIVFAALIDGAVRARGDNWRPLRLCVRVAPTLALLVGAFLCTRYAFRDLVDPATYQSDPRTQAAERVLSQIPDGVTVETDFGVMAMLTHRTRVLRMGYGGPVVPDFVLIDALTHQNPPASHPVQYAESLHPGATYVLVDGGGGFTLMSRVP